MRLDLLVSRPDIGKHLALELKYLTATWAGEVDGEQFGLLSQGAQDIRAYDVIKDVQRVERFADDHSGWSGMVLVLSNDPSYWSRPKHGRVTNADAFRIYEDQVISGSRVWGPDTGAGTMKDRKAVIELRGDYRCHWSPYSALPGSRGDFRLLVLPVGKPCSSPRAPAVERELMPLATDLRSTDLAADAELTPEEDEITTDGQRYRVADLRAQLRRFEHQLRTAGLKETSISTYVDRTSRFLRWLDGDYQPRGPN
jgi:hypothetical protein